MLLISIFSALPSISAFAWFGATPESPPVVELHSEAELKNAIELHELTAVLFYASWCTFSQQVLPIWKELGQKTLQEPRLGVAQIDVDQYREVGQLHEISEYPEILLFTRFASDNSGKAATSDVFKYPHGLPRSWAAFSNWIHVHADRLTNFATAAQAEEAMNGHDFMLVSATPVDDMKALVEASRHFETVSFATAEPAALEWFRTQYPSASNHGIFLISPYSKSGAEGFTGNFRDAGEIDRFVKGRMIEPISIFNMWSAERIFGVGLPTLVIALEEDMEIPWLPAIAELGKGYLLVAKSIGNYGMAEKKLADMLACEAEPFPYVRIIQEVPSAYRTHQGAAGLVHHCTKFRPEVDQENSPAALSEEVVKKFVSDFIAGKLKPYLKSEPEGPPALPSEVLELVATTFHQGVLQSDAPVFVDFFAHWCGHCRMMTKDWDRLARKLGKLTRYVRIARIDVTKNEVPTVNIRGYPTLLLYKKGSAPIEYTGERNVDGWMNFLIAQGVLTGKEELVAELQGSEL